MYTIINIIILLSILSPLRCSMVLDRWSKGQESIYTSKYCTEQKYCKEGSHVMCMYYNHQEIYGPHCQNIVPTKMTSVLIKTVLANVNTIRGRLATGKENGKNGVKLPRAYGMMKIEWDEELAILAQVLANQCLGGREDMCRSTDKFPNPSQNIAIIQFKYPDWGYLQLNDTEKGLTEKKLLFALNRFFRSSRSLRKSVTPEIISDCPPMHELSDLNSKYYLNIIYGAATHIGCGIVAYTRFSADSGKDAIHNSVQIVCNISEAPQTGQSLYSTYPPITGLGFSERCGCPKGHKETQECLCEEDPHKNSKITSESRTPPNTSPRKPAINEPLNTQLDDKLTKLNEKVKQELMKSMNNQICNEKLRNCEMRVVVLPILSIRNDMDSPDKNARINNASAILEEHLKTFSPDEVDELLKSLTEKRGKKNSKVRFSYQQTDSNNFSNYQMKAVTDNSQREGKGQLTRDFSAEEQSLPLLNERKETVTEKEHNRGENYPKNYWKYSKQPDYSQNDEKVNLKVQNKNNDNTDILSILDILEKAVKKVVLDGKIKQEFNLKMKKIYEVALGSPQTGLKSFDDSDRNIPFKASELRKKFPREFQQTNVENNSFQEVESYMKTKEKERVGGTEARNTDEIITKKRVENEQIHDYNNMMQLIKSTEPKYRISDNIDNTGNKNSPISTKYDDIFNPVKTQNPSNKRLVYNNMFNFEHKSIFDDDDFSNIPKVPETFNLTETPLAEALKPASFKMEYKTKSVDDDNYFNPNDIKELLHMRKTFNENYDTRSEERDNLDTNDEVETLRRSTFAHPVRRTQIDHSLRRIHQSENMRPMRRMQKNEFEPIKNLYKHRTLTDNTRTLDTERIF